MSRNKKQEAVKICMNKSEVIDKVCAMWNKIREEVMESVKMVHKKSRQVH